MKKTDQDWMAMALRLARLGEGLTRPNPPVGAVVVKHGRVIGRGYHRRAGGPHAEVYALRQAHSRARGATLYVSLEPCSTWGRTPPCTEAIIAAGIQKVVVAVPDPNPLHAGRGLRVLRKAGIEVKCGVCATEAAAILAPFASSMLRRRPWITLKLAQSWDGRIADRAGHSKWISGPGARVLVQDMRRRADAVMVGAGTVLKDNPTLLPRPAKGRNPIRIVVDAAGRVPVSCSLFSDDAAHHSFLATTRRCPELKRRAVASRGGHVLLLPKAGRALSLPALMKALYARGILHVLCEGGGELAASLIRAGLVDDYVMFVAPVVMGGDGTASVGGPGWPLSSAPRMKIVEVRPVGKDVMLRAVALKG